MKKTQKKVVGLFGLALVAAVTIFAAFLPGPEASAISSVTDTVTITVVSPTASIVVTSPEDGSVTTTSDFPIGVDYTELDALSITIKYTDEDGTVHTKVIDAPISDISGSYSFNFNELGDEFGFGEYEIAVNGTGNDGSPVEKTIEFSYYPVVATVETDDETGTTYVDLDYDPYDPSGAGDGKVDKIVIIVKDENGQVIDSIPPIIVDAPTKRVELPLAENGLGSGKYIIDLQAYGSEGDSLYLPYVVDLDFKNIPVPSAGTPDTGSLFAGLNISKADYIITGLVIFGMVAVGSFVMIRRRGKRN